MGPFVPGVQSTPPASGTITPLRMRPMWQLLELHPLGSPVWPPWRSSNAPQATTHMLPLGVAPAHVSPAEPSRAAIGRTAMQLDARSVPSAALQPGIPATRFWAGPALFPVSY